MVITGLTRNQFVGIQSGTWVRIPPCPPNKAFEKSQKSCFSNITLQNITFLQKHLTLQKFIDIILFERRGDYEQFEKDP